MQDQLLLTVTGDKGGVGKSSITALMTEWFWFKQRSVRVIDADRGRR